MTQTADILTGASVLVATGWAQDFSAVNADGDPVPPESPDAAAFCPLGAIRRATVDSFDQAGDVQSAGAVAGRQRRAQELAAAYLPEDFRAAGSPGRPAAAITEWNDAHGRTVEQVCAVLNAAAEAANDE